MTSDLRYAWRKLLRSPGFTAIAILALALGIGATSAMFTLVDAVLLRPLPYSNPARLFAVYEGIPAAGLSTIPFSTPDYVVFARENGAFSSLGGFQNADFELSGLDRPERVTGARVTASLFPTLGIRPARGRVFTEEEDRQAAPVALISYALWQEAFAGRPAIDRTLLLDRRPYQIIGVLPENLELPSRGPEYNSEPAAVIVPMSYTPAELRQYGARFATSVIARLRPGFTAETARAEDGRMAARFLDFYPPSIKARGLTLSVSLRPLKEDVAGQSQTLLLVLLSAVFLVLLIACADIANLMLTRAASRRREFSLRAALGAGRGQLLRGVLIESAILAAAGGLAGLALAEALLRLLEHSSPLDLPRMAGAHIDLAALAFTAAVAALTTIFFGLAPALAALRSPAAEALKESARGTAGRKQARLLGSFVALQFALALVLLVSAGLLLRSFQRLAATDPGFQPEHVIALSLSLPHTTYQRASDIRSFYARLEDAARALPGVGFAGESNATPLHMARQITFTVENAAAGAPGIPPTASAEYVSGDYFRTLGVRLLSGRWFGAGDGPEAEPVAIVNQTLARHFYPDGALGRRIKFGIRGSYPWMTIVGVVADIKQGPLNTAADPGIYQPLAQVPDPTVADPLSGGVRARHLIVRTAGDPESIARALIAAVHSLDPDLAIGKLQTLTDMVHESSAPQRFDTELLGSFAAIALLLAALGAGGVLSYTTAQRTQEIGIRVALGARRNDILRMVMLHGLKLAAAGMTAGLVAAWLATRFLSKLLYHVGPRDPRTFAAVCVVLAVVAVLAAVVPARRALAIDPIVALRHE